MAHWMRYILHRSGKKQATNRREILDALDAAKAWVTLHVFEDQGGDVEVAIDVPLEAGGEPEEAF